MLPQWHVKDPGSSAKSASGRLHLNTHTSLTQRSRTGMTMPLSRHSVGTYQETSSQNSSGNARPQSSQLAESLCADPGVESGISVREQISTKQTNKQTKSQVRNKRSNILPKSSQARKKPLPPFASYKPSSVVVKDRRLPNTFRIVSCTGRS